MSTDCLRKQNLVDNKLPPANPMHGQLWNNPSCQGKAILLEKLLQTHFCSMQVLSLVCSALPRMSQKEILKGAMVWFDSLASANKTKQNQLANVDVFSSLIFLGTNIVYKILRKILSNMHPFQWDKAGNKKSKAEVTLKHNGFWKELVDGMPYLGRSFLSIRWLLLLVGLPLEYLWGIGGWTRFVAGLARLFFKWHSDDSYGWIYMNPFLEKAFICSWSVQFLFFYSNVIACASFFVIIHLCYNFSLCTGLFCSFVHI